MNARQKEWTRARIKVFLATQGYWFAVIWGIIGKPQSLQFTGGFLIIPALALALGICLNNGFSWSRHVVGILTALVLPGNLLFLAISAEYRSMMLTEYGLLSLFTVAAATWTAWTLLFDPEVIEWFHAGDPEER